MESVDKLINLVLGKFLSHENKSESTDAVEWTMMNQRRSDCWLISSPFACAFLIFVATSKHLLIRPMSSAQFTITQNKTVVNMNVSSAHAVDNNEIDDAYPSPMSLVPVYEFTRMTHRAP